MSYKPFTRAEFEKALPARWQLAEDVPAQELVYRWPGQGKYVNWAVLCYSGLAKASGVSRAVGQDAIRFVLIDTVSGKAVGKTTRVHRTGDVASLTARLKDRIGAMGKLCVGEEPKRCKRCGAATVDRVKKATGETFRGCMRWQECRTNGAAVAQPPDPMPQPVAEPEPLEEELTRADVDLAPLRPETPVAQHPQVTQVLRTVDDKVLLVPTAKVPWVKLPFAELNPMQSLVVPYVTEDVNLVVAAPTSAGKTVVAELLAGWALTVQRRKALFLSPLKAVTQEKYDEWQERFVGRNISIVTGDYQLTKKRQAELTAADLILLTSEMLDSRTRRMAQEGNAWLMDAAVLVCDECHLISVESRGPALETGLVRFTDQNPAARVVLLSATMPNVEELGNWLSRLNGKHTVVIKSTWRPVPHETHYRPHLAGPRMRYRQMEEDKLQQTVQLIVEEFPDDRFLAFVHSKATGRALLAKLKDHGVEAEFHSADLSKEDRLRIEAEFRKK